MTSARPKASSLNALHTMRSNRRVSATELALRRALWAAGARNYRVATDLVGRPDLVFPRARVAVFVHGCFWHRCPLCQLPRPKANYEFWDHKFEENLRRDARVSRSLQDQGWTPLVVWEHEIRRGASKAAEDVLDFIRLTAKGKQ